MKKRKMLATLLAVGMILSMLAGCSNTTSGSSSATSSGAASQSSSSVAAGPVTISALLWDSDIPQQTQDLINAFMKKYPNIKVNMQNMTGSGTSENLQPKAAADALPDLFSMDGDAFGNQLADSGKVLDVSNTTAWKNMIPSMQTQWTSPKGVHFGISGGVCTCIYYYNEDLFAKAGIKSFPTNWDDFITTCNTLKAKGITPMIFYGADANDLANANISYGFAQYVIKSDSSVVSKIKDGSENLNTDAVAGVFDKIKQFPTSGYAQKGYMSTDYNTSSQLFVQGKAAMIFQGTWLAGTLTNTSFKVGCAIPPYNAKGEQQIPVLSSETGWGVSAHASAANRDAAVKLLEFWNGEGFHIYQNPRMCIPPFKDTSSLGTIKLAPQVTSVMNQITSSSITPAPLYFVYMSSNLVGNIQKIIQQVLLGQITSKQAAQQCDTLNKAAASSSSSAS